MKHTHNRPRRRRTDVCPNPYDDLYFSQLAQEILQGVIFFSGLSVLMIFLVAGA